MHRIFPIVIIIRLSFLSAFAEELLHQDLSSLLDLGLPVVEIRTPNNSAIVSKDVWMEDVAISILLPNGQRDVETIIEMKGRGNSTWNVFPKKPYTLKFKSKTSLLHMPSGKKWVLLANWMDRTLMRNDIAFEIARRVSSAWVPQGKHVNLILNQQYMGVYYLCEKIEVDKNRVNIVKMTSDDIEGENVTGGYLMELDVSYDETNKFHSAVYQLPYMFHSPKEDVLTQEQVQYLQDYIRQMEEALAIGNNASEWLSDESFANWWIANELAGNREAIHPKSVYMYKNRNNLLMAGPVWDFDSGTFIPLYANTIYSTDFLYYPVLFQLDSFKSLLLQRWTYVKDALKAIPEYIQEQAELLRGSEELNAELWPISTRINHDEELTFDEAVNEMKRAYIIKYNAVDKYLLDITNSIPNASKEEPVWVSDVFYDLSGRQLSTPPSHGLYICNGKKIHKK